MTRVRARPLAFLPLAVLTAACGSEPVQQQHTSTNPPDPVCEAGQTQPCYDGPAGTQDVGLCRAGTRACKADGSGFEEACVGQVTPLPESCATPGDDDCNGLANDGCACEPGQKMACYTGPAGTKGVGNCVAGEAVCNPDGLGFGPCMGEVLPQTESCATPGDDDCNGQVNDGCACVPGTTAPCYSGPAATLDVGICKGGSAVCLPSGLGYGTCTGEVLPAAKDDCATPEDENCDGVVNDAASSCVCQPGATEACYEGPSGTMNVGTCSAGQHTCLPSGEGFGSCTGQVVPAAKDDCATPQDENCDGVVNEASSGCVCQPGTTQPCYDGPPGTLGVGACKGGAQTCNATGDGYGACAGQTLPGNEVCDGVDNDCNGSVDELGCGGTALWSRAFGSTGIFEAGSAVAVDPTNGDVVITGYVGGPADFGGGVITSGGSAFLARYTATGTHLWSKRLGASHGSGLTIDASGSIFLVGDFQGTVDFGGGAITSKGNSDAFVAKFTAAGVNVWSKAFGGFQSDGARGVAVDVNGNILVTGVVAKDVSGSINLGGGSVPSPGWDDVFLVKLSPTGAYLWSKIFGSTTSDDYGQSVATDAAGNIILAGTVSDSVNLGSGAMFGGTQDAFIAKYDATGAYLWSKRIAGTGRAGATDAVVVDTNGDIIFSGLGVGTIDLGGGPLSAISNYYDAFVVKYTPAGNHVWSLLHKSPNSGQLDHGLALDTSGNVLLAGNLQSQPKAAFVTKYSSAGAVLWDKTFVSSSDASTNAVAASPTGNVAITGYFGSEYSGGTIDFGTGPFTSTAGRDGFVAVLPP